MKKLVLGIVLVLALSACGGDSTGKVATPVANPPKGAIAVGTEIILSTITEGATIYYTIDGNNPSEEEYLRPRIGSTFLYWPPFIAYDESFTLKAIAVKEGMTTSDMLTAKYTTFNYIVTFYNNGNVYHVNNNAIYNRNISAPNVPILANHIFQGWYKEESFENKWDFTSDTVTDNISLYARWSHNVNGPFELGDTGPGGGIIFYYDPDGFTVEGATVTGSYANRSFSTYTAHYLEAPKKVAAFSACQLSPSGSIIDGTTTFTSLSDEKANKIGNGRKDTLLIAKYNTDSIFGDPVFNFGYVSYLGDKNDWFLPSLGELYALISFVYSTRPSEIILLNTSYLSSSHYDSYNSWVVRYSSGGSVEDVEARSYLPKQTAMHFVCPIRAF